MNFTNKNIEIIFSRLIQKLSNKNVILVSHTFEDSKQKYSLLKFILGEGNKRKALISAGIHGEEPGGVEDICKFIESKTVTCISEQK